MRNFTSKWIIALMLLCVSSVIYAVNKSTWTVKDGKKEGVLYAANGKLASGHQFGFLKVPKHCDADVLWVRLSSKDKSVKNMKGQKVDVAIMLDGATALVIPLEYFQYIPVPQSDVIATIFTNTPMNAKFIDLLKKSKTVDVKIQSPQALAQLMQVSAEEFDLAGMTEARTQAYNLCKKQ